MTRDRRLLLLMILLMAYGSFVVEGRYRRHEDTLNEARHRHRHRHESSSGRRNRHDPTDRGLSSWSQELDYEDDSVGDRDDREDTEEDEDDYEGRGYYERSYPRSSRTGYHGRAFEARYPAGYRRGYHGSGWYEEDEDGRRAPSRYSGSSHRFRSERTHRRSSYPKNHDSTEFEYEQEDGDIDYERQRRYENEGLENHRAWWRNSRRHRIDSRRDWRGRAIDLGRRHRPDETDHWKRLWRTNSTDARFPLVRNDRRKNDDSPDYDYRVDGSEEETEEDNIWREAESEVENEEDEELDNDFYRSEKKPPLKTYDDIIRRLTSDDPTTPRSTVKRDYRNIEIDKYIKRETFGNLKYEPKNISRPYSKIVSKPTNDRKVGKDGIGLAVKGNDRQERKNVAKVEDTRTKTKSLEQDYDEYVNAPDNEKEEDLIKAGVEEDSGMQADVTNTDYTEDENVDEDETPATQSPSTSTSTTTTTTTTTTTSTPRPQVTQNYDYRDPRAYEGSTGTQYNGYQSKNDYPPMSAHSVHKWQSLGTRESVKETRSNMQQYNKNGKSAEIREALQHAIKVSREGSCQWPRPRVIPVRDVYPSPSTTYIPHCAILHRCSDDTGCCRSEALTCVPKHTHRVELSFYTTNVGGSSVVEKLSFYNHTECECRERSEYETANDKPSEQRVYRHYQSSPQPQNMRRAQPRKPCRCPSEFTPRITPEGECQCNCYETHQNCIKTRRGKGYFSLADRLCIQNEECATPMCEFGEYMRRQGKCPRKKDKFDAIANYRANLHHRYRS